MKRCRTSSPKLEECEPVMSNLAQRIGKLTPERRAMLRRYLAGEEGAATSATSDAIAVIGLGCRFPFGANHPEAFWELLKNGVDAITEVPGDRWQVEPFYDPNPEAPGKVNTRWGGFLDQVDGFDYKFFGITPREASKMDPQQRLLLEVAWEAIEDAGQTLENLKGSATGVFIGICTSDYSILQVGDQHSLDAYTATGNAFSIAANRLSYQFDLRGPSLAVDTACSSSLSAIHLACQSLRNRECHLALAGGVNLLLSPLWTIALTKWGVMAADGRCKAFDVRADGFVRGEGCGVIVLKRLSDALPEGDQVLAVIRGSALNQDGRSVGLTAPHGPAQEAVISQALRMARVAPSQVTYIETHGTGTALGDPIEIEALAAVLGQSRGEGQFCALGAVKTNIGHLEAAAGVAGLIKVVLALKYGAIPPNLHFHQLNPHISLEGTPFVIPTELLLWPPKSEPRYAGVSSFGFGGTNVHLILEEAPPLAPPSQKTQMAGNRVQIFTVSAQGAEALKSRSHADLKFLLDESEGSESSLADICYSSSVRRSHHDHRLALVAGTREELLAGLAGFEAGERPVGMAHGVKDSNQLQGVVFIFSGQGSQWIGMGLDLLEQEPVFRASLERCDGLLRNLAGWSILSELRAEESRWRLNETQFAQPVIFAIQVSLAACWRAWGVEPEAVAGHSVGEIAAAHVAGVLSLEDAIRVVWHRGRLMQGAMGKGTMVAVKLTPAEAERALVGHERRVSIAAINGPRSVVLSGESDSLSAVVRSLQRENVSCRWLEVDYAFHSPQMRPFKQELVGVLSGLALQVASCTLFSTVVGEVSCGTDFDADYWGRNMTEPVRFAAAVNGLLDYGFNLFIEIGSHPVLSGAISECLRQRRREGVALASMRRHEVTRRNMLSALGVLYASGYSVDWSRLYPEPQRFVRLPSYPWQRQRCWINAGAAAVDAGREYLDRTEAHSSAHPFLRRHVPLAHPPGSHLWLIEVDSRKLSYLDDHRIQQAVVLPGAAYIEIVLAAAAEVFGEAPRILKELEFRRALFVSEDEAQLLQLVLSPIGNGEVTFHLYSEPNEIIERGHEPNPVWALHVTGNISHQRSPDDVGDRRELDEIRGRCMESIPGADFYAFMAEYGNQWGPCFRGIERIWRGRGEALALVRVPDPLLSQLDHYRFHPALIDACGHGLAITKIFDEQPGHNRRAFMGGGVREVQPYQPLSNRRYWSHLRARRGVEAEAEVLEGDARIFDETGELVAKLIGIQFRYLEPQVSGGTSPNPEDWLYEIQWQPRENSNEQSPLSHLEASASDRWLIFSDRHGIGTSLARTLLLQGASPVLVFAGRAFKRIGRTNFRVRPESPDDLRRLFETLAADGEVNWRFVVHLWSLDASADDRLTLTALTSAQNLGCGGVLHLLNALPGSAARLWLITRGAQPVNGSSDSTSIAQSTLWGLGRTLAQEHAAFWGGLVDIGPDSVPGSAARALLHEILHPDGEDQLAFRQGRRYVARLVRRMRQPVRRSSSFQLRADASYLITGGLGGIGLHVARWMVEQGARRLVLMGRTRLPARAAWSEVEADALPARQIAAVRELESLGASIHLAFVDVGDRAQLKSFFETFRRECWPPIRGVVHAAGIAHYQSLAETKIEDLHLALRAKVSGAWLLHHLLEDIPLDFFILFSSMSAILNSPWLGSYAAGNAFLDALAAHRRARNLPALSIAWGPWGEAGMAVRNYPGKSGRPQQQEMLSMPPHQALEALSFLLQSDPPAQVGVMPIVWQQWWHLYPLFTAAPLFAHLRREEAGAASAAHSPHHSRSLTREVLLAAPSSARWPLLEEFVCQQVSDVMGIARSELDVEQPLSQVGIDSLMALELKHHIELSLKTTLPMVRFLQGPSIKTLIKLLLEQIVSAPPSISADTPEEMTRSNWEILRI
jgi:acyl transferase domain-containing protein